jgi:hypothetical protein
VTKGRIRALIAWAEQHGADAQLCLDASDEYLDLIDRPAPDRRLAATFDRARRIEALRARGIPRADICTRLRITPRQHDRARAVLRDFGGTEPKDLPAVTAAGVPNCPDT